MKKSHGLWQRVEKLGILLHLLLPLHLVITKFYQVSIILSYFYFPFSVHRDQTFLSFSFVYSTIQFVPLFVHSFMHSFTHVLSSPVPNIALGIMSRKL